ncbi:MAG TPA: endolytic transglycosylase MltG [Ktedonobacteraceae bacterium]|jgi:UPF0755 protein|nr:endolytic transglycosylase MltG [Ktedonobacteraceae bacterium]
MSKPRSRVAIISILLLGVIIFLFVLYGYNTGTDVFSAVDSNSHAQVSVTVVQGESSAQIANDLQKKGLIRNALAFRIWARIKGLDKQLQAGVYTKLSPNMSTSQIVDNLQNAQPDATLVLIPEGWRLEQVAQKYASSGLAKFNQQQFLKYAKHINEFPDASKYPILKDVPAGRSMEGLLFPATYEVPVSATTTDVLDLMLQKTTDEVAQNHIATLAKQHGLSMYQTFILASIVQREVLHLTDSPGVASVYYNRAFRQNAETNGLLEADPTVQYARDSDNPPKVYWKPLNDVGGNIAPNSAWNTYVHAGLPPTPICSPGLAPLMAAAAPLKSNNYFFFSKKDGTTVYDQTNAQFEADKRKYLGG